MKELIKARQTLLSSLKYSKNHRFSSFQRKPESSNTLNISDFSESQTLLG